MTDATTFQLTMSPTIGKLAEALAKAQTKLAPATKDATNPHFKNRYATLASCFEAVKPLHENGIAIVQPPAPHGQDGVCVRTLLLHSSGEWICGELYMPATKKDAQGFGSALSYARRYCLQATCGLATDDDDANAAVGAPKPETNGQHASKRDPIEEELAGLYRGAATAADIAKADAAAAGYSREKKLTQAARAKLIPLRDEAARRVETEATIKAAR